VVASYVTGHAEARLDVAKRRRRITRDPGSLLCERAQRDRRRSGSQHRLRGPHRLLRRNIAYFRSKRLFVGDDAARIRRRATRSEMVRPFRHRACCSLRAAIIHRREWRLVARRGH
jgi:hypothetical protein